MIAKRSAGFGLAPLLLLGLTALAPVSAQVIEAPYSSSYSYISLNTPTGVPGPFGGLTLKAGDANTLLIGGTANNPGGGIYSIGLTRGLDNHITGFSGTASLFSTAPNIDGGLVYAPNGDLLYTAFPTNQIGEIKPGSTTPDKVISLPGVSSSVGSLQFIPAGFVGAGQLAIASYNGGGYYTSSLIPDGSGTYDLGTQTLQANLGHGPEGITFVPAGNAQFAVNSILVSEYQGGNVATYALDSLGNPIEASRALFITGLNGAEGAFTDPLTGDFLFSTFGGSNQVIEVRGFIPVPESPVSVSLGLMLALGFGGLCLTGRRKRGDRRVS